MHELIGSTWIDLRNGAGDDKKALCKHLVSSHTPIDAVGAVAEEADAKTLVLSRIVPGNAPDPRLR